MPLLAIYLACMLAGAALALWRPPQLPRFWLLLAIAAVPQIGAMLGIWIVGMFLVSAATIVIWCLCNRAIAGVLVVAAGMLMNLLPMALHGGAMPIDAAVLDRVGVVAPVGATLLGSKDVVVQSSPLRMLSDWMVLPFDLITVIASPGDLVVIVGIIWWLLFSHQQERDQPMMSFRTTAAPLDRRGRLLSGQSARPALTRLALLAAANPAVAESLLRDPLDAAAAHPHYAVSLDAHDRATLADIRAGAHTVGEFLSRLADVVDGAVA